MTTPLLDILARYEQPRKKTARELTSPCPFCGGNDRFCIFPYASQRNGEEIPPHAWCRQCGWWGTAVMLLRDKEHISYKDAQAIIDGSRSFNDVSKDQPRASRQAVKTTPANADGAPCQEWQWSGKAFCKVAKAALWSEAGEKALSYLRNRSMSDESIEQCNFGYNTRDWHVECPADWGLTDSLWLPRGIVIPYTGEDQLWKIEIRLPTESKEKRRYHNVKGSANALYGYEDLRYRGKAVVVEGVFDAIAMRQVLAEIGCSITAVVATGSTDGSHGTRWLMRLGICESVVIAFDADGSGAGDKAATWWLERLSNAKRWKPLSGDINDMYLANKEILIEATRGFFTGSSATMDNSEIAQNAQFFEELSTECCLCGKELECYDEYGCAWCAEHAPGVAETSEEVQEVAVPVQETPASPEPAKVIPMQSRRRREPEKTAAMCSADGCYGIARGYDALGGQWCSNCQLRRKFVDGMADLGFPRLAYAPTHFVESGEEATKGFAKSMSMTAILLAVREVREMTERATG